MKYEQAAQAIKNPALTENTFYKEYIRELIAREL